MNLARDGGLRIWEKPASACLSSRIEYGRPVTHEALSVIEQGEDALRASGFRQFGFDIMVRLFALRLPATSWHVPSPRDGGRVHSHLQRRSGSNS